MATLPNEGETTFPCDICGRRFVKSSLEKHQPVCKKLTKARRKIFDSGKQRATGSDIPINDVQNARKEREKIGGTYPRPKTSWREKHDTFVSAVSASRQVDYALKTGTPLPPPPKTSVPKDYVQCEYCGRNFNGNTALRHIPFCKEQNERKGPMRMQPNLAKPLLAKHNNAVGNAPPWGTSPTSRNEPPAPNRHEPPARSRPGRVPSRRASVDRDNAGSRQSPSRPSVNSASNAHRSNLPTPVKRSNSASRIPQSAQSRSHSKTSSSGRHHARY